MYNRIYAAKGVQGGKIFATENAKKLVLDNLLLPPYDCSYLLHLELYFPNIIFSSLLVIKIYYKNHIKSIIGFFRKMDILARMRTNTVTLVICSVQCQRKRSTWKVWEQLCIFPQQFAKKDYPWKNTCLKKSPPYVPLVNSYVLYAAK